MDNDDFQDAGSPAPSTDQDVFLTGGGCATVAGKKYAVGLMWQSVNSGGGSPVKQARQSAKSHDADLIAIRNKTQFALGTTKSGQKPGMRSLAALIAENIDDTFVGAFEVPEGVYVVAVRDEQIVPGCERLYENKEEAVEFFSDLFFGPTWGQAFAPEDWAIEKTVHTSIEIVIQGARTSVKLQEATETKKLIRFGALLLILGVGMGGYHLYQGHLQTLHDAELLRIAREAENQKPPPPPPPPPLPWTAKNNGVTGLMACEEAMRQAPINVPGWLPSEVSCSPDEVPNGVQQKTATVSVTFKRNGGTINWIAPYISHKGFSPHFRVLEGGKALVYWQINLSGPWHQEKVATKPEAQVIRYLTSQFEENFHTIKITPLKPPPEFVQRGRLQEKVPPRYQYLAFSFKTPHAPKEFVEILAPIPAITLDKVVLDLSKWTWLVEGKVYESLQPQGAPRGTPR